MNCLASLKCLIKYITSDLWAVKRVCVGYFITKVFIFSNLINFFICDFYLLVLIFIFILIIRVGISISSHVCSFRSVTSVCCISIIKNAFRVKPITKWSLHHYVHIWSVPAVYIQNLSSVVHLPVLNCTNSENQCVNSQFSIGLSSYFRNAFFNRY